MKKSEMIEMLADEIEEIIEMSKFKSVNDAGFCERRAAGLLDLILGLGMQLPKPKMKPLNPGVLYTACEHFKTCPKGTDGSCGGCNGPKSRYASGFEPED